MVFNSKTRIYWLLQNVWIFKKPYLSISRKYWVPLWESDTLLFNDFKRIYFNRALEGNISNTSKELGINRSALHKMLKDISINYPPWSLLKKAICCLFATLLSFEYDNYINLSNNFIIIIVNNKSLTQNYLCGIVGINFASIP